MYHNWLFSDDYKRMLCLNFVCVCKIPSCILISLLLFSGFSSSFSFICDPHFPISSFPHWAPSLWSIHIAMVLFLAAVNIPLCMITPLCVSCPLSGLGPWVTFNSPPLPVTLFLTCPFGNILVHVPVWGLLGEV